MVDARSITVTVLVVDDSVETRRRLAEMLVEQAMTCVMECPARHAEVFDLLAGLTPDCVVIDVPVQNPAGFELLASIRRALPVCLMIALTNHFSESFRQRAFEVGADHCLAKSTEFERVADLTRALREKT